MKVELWVNTIIFALLLSITIGFQQWVIIHITFYYDNGLNGIFDWIMYVIVTFFSTTFAIVILIIEHERTKSRLLKEYRE